MPAATRLAFNEDRVASYESVRARKASKPEEVPNPHADRPFLLTHCPTCDRLQPHDHTCQE
ncbi:MAG: hypothetical protein CL878_03660 [Dehalococcoidia bacterium]|nr:hypothetical protein [Dehalococcoidia bacterium]